MSRDDSLWFQGKMGFLGPATLSILQNKTGREVANKKMYNTG